MMMFKLLQGLLMRSLEKTQTPFLNPGNVENQQNT